MRRLALALALAALGIAAPAAADEAVRAATPPAGGGADAAPKVRASHRVDVIAPGERIETVLDRARASAPPVGPRDAGATGALPVRPPDRRSLTPPPEPIRPGVGPPPAGGTAPLGPTRGDAPPPERPRSR